MTIPPATALPQLETVRPDVYRWSAYSPAHRVELTSHAVRTSTGIVIFDPLPMTAPQMDSLVAHSRPTIVLTNGNHTRAAALWHERFRAPIHAPADVALEFRIEYLVTRRGASRARFPGDWETILLPGGAPGETAFFLASQSLMVFGDAVVQLPGRGLELLPDKYCENPAQLRASLAGLLNRAFTTALMAHGNPVLADAHARLRALL